MLKINKRIHSHYFLKRTQVVLVKIYIFLNYLDANLSNSIPNFDLFKGSDENKIWAHEIEVAQVLEVLGMDPNCASLAATRRGFVSRNVLSDSFGWLVENEQSSEQMRKAIKVFDVNRLSAPPDLI